MSKTFQLDIVSAEKSLFSGLAKQVDVPGVIGELGIFPGHSPLLTKIKPGTVNIIAEDGQSEVFFVSGGMLEVQPKIVTILADTAERAEHLDEAAAVEAKKRAEQIIAEQKNDVDYARAIADLAEAVARIQAIRQQKNRIK